MEKARRKINGGARPRFRASWPPRIACAEVVVICLGVLLALFGHAPSLTSALGTAEVEALPSRRVMLSLRSSVLRPPPTSHPASHWTSPFRLIPTVTVGVGHRPSEISPVPPPTFTTSHSPYAGGFFATALPGSSPLPWPSLSPELLGSLSFPLPQGLT